MELYEGQLKDIELNIQKTHIHNKKSGHSYHKYCNDIFVLDIEVTSAWIENGNVIGYRKGESNEYWNNLEPISLPYVWQFSYNDNVYYGREFFDFYEVLCDLPNDVDIIIWVHNLSYEFHFLSNFLEWKTVFAKSPHKPMKAVPTDFPNIEFRCSYYLTQLSLESWGKQIGFKKASGDLDYEILRTPLTPLTEQELGYCERDCLVVYYGIKKYLETYKVPREIPLTQTGTVRRIVKELLMEDEMYFKNIKKLVPRSADEYKILMDIFSGGYTHANRLYSGMTSYGVIEHYDFASSYPTVMISEKYPMTKWDYIPSVMRQSLTEIENTFDEYAYIMKIQFNNIVCNTWNTYIQSSKCMGSNFELDNGRVISADELIITCTEQDYLTIKETYSWDTLEIIDLYQSKKGYLPKDFITYILQLYENKTTLKDVEGMEDLYMQSKQYINSLYGMCVTAIVQANIKYDNGEWTMEELTEEMVNKKLSSLRINRPREKRYFLSYSWGCWVTAYARRNLWKCVIPNDDKVLYCDTDSIFILGKHNFKWYNDEITAKLKATCIALNIPFEKTRPKTPKGKEKALGIFDKEDDCIEFKSLGAKRYVERRASDKQLHLTVSGINKDAVKLLNDNIDNFDDGFNFDKDSEYVHKSLHTYIDNAPCGVKFPDGYVSNYTKGINMRRNGYLLTMSDDYKNLIELSKLNLSDIDFKKLKARWI